MSDQTPNEEIEYEVVEEVDLPGYEDTPEDDEEIDVSGGDLPDGEEAGE